MNSASVGFQCPECVKEGARTTRQARATYGGRRVLDASRTTLALIGANVLVWIAVLAGGGQDGSLFQKLALLPRTTGYRFPDGTVHVVQGVSGGAYWQLLTSVFTHVSVLHIGFNMLALYFLGPVLESVLGRARFLAIYLVSGLVGSAAVVLLSSPGSQTVGASGAVFGLMGALVVVGLKRRLDVGQILFWIGLNLVFTFTNTGSISWQGHLGGLLGGALLAGVVVYAPRQRREVVQWLGVAVVALVALVAAVVGAAAL